MKKIVLASHNEGKLREIRAILSGWEIIGMRQAGFTDEIEENGATFYENAVIKAKAVSEALGVPALADDSGLVVDALGGAPGVYSARFAGEDGNDGKNNEKLLNELDGVKREDRKAKFVSCVALYLPDGRIFRGDGEVCGEILFGLDGDGGFGYDPLFYSSELRKSFGRASAEEKNSVSHRFRAISALKSKIEGVL